MEYSVKFVNQWSLSPGVTIVGGMRGLQVGTEYELMFEYEYNVTGYHATDHVATFAVESDEDTFLNGYEWSHKEGIQINEESCENQVRTDAPTISPMPTVAPTVAPTPSPVSVARATLTISSAWLGVAAVILQKIVS